MEGPSLNSIDENNKMRPLLNKKMDKTNMPNFENRTILDRLPIWTIQKISIWNP